MDPSSRPVLFIGSYPAHSTHQAMFEMLAAARNADVPLLAVPDGETGERGDWIQDEMAMLEDHPALELAGIGANYAGWDDLPSLRVTDPSALTAGSIGVRLGYAHYASLARTTLEGLRQFGLGAGVPPQVGMPAALDLTMAVAGVPGLGHLPVFQRALLDHIADIHTLDPETVVQLETPVALNLAIADGPHLPAPLRTDAIAASICDTARGAPDGTRFGLHLCFGDLHHTGRVDQPVTEPSVALATAVLDGWPAARPLVYLHIPLAAGRTPPTTEPGRYEVLGKLGDRLPEGATVVAGIAHEAQPIEDQCQVLDLVEAALGQPVGVAAACGLGRRTLTNARTVARQMVELATV